MDMAEMQDLIVDDRVRGTFRVNRRVFTDPEILELINTALYRAKVPINPKARRQLIIKSISPKQRPRCPVA